MNSVPIYIHVSNTKFFLLTDPPSVTLSVQPQTVTEGAKVLFICSASAHPEITGYRYSSIVIISILYFVLASPHREPVHINVYNCDTVQSYTKIGYAAKKPKPCKGVFSRFIRLNGLLDWQCWIVIGTSHESANSHFDTHG